MILIIFFTSTNQIKSTFLNLRQIQKIALEFNPINKKIKRKSPLKRFPFYFS